MNLLDIIKYFGVAILVFVVFYIIMRIGSSAVFRSYFEAAKRSSLPPKKGISRQEKE